MELQAAAAGMNLERRLDNDMIGGSSSTSKLVVVFPHKVEEHQSFKGF